MGRTVYWMNVSLDLRIEASANENGGGNWMRIGEPLHREFNRRAAELAMMVQGRTMFEIMEDYWPAAAEDESEEDVMREYGRIWTDLPKVLVSSARTEAEHNTRVIGGVDPAEAIERLARLRAETDGTIGVGGATVATHLLRAGLLDELLLFTHPVVLGAGRPLFDEPAPLVECDLLEQAQFEDGVVMHRWAVRGARPIT